MGRPDISDRVLMTLVTDIRQELHDQVVKKGRASFVSSHETRGALAEEVDEFNAAVHSNDRAQVRRELMDVVVAACWGLASEAAGGWDR